ncbi:DsbA family protein [Subtercola frigoramans]|uniref:Protein-disulfide isomerase n=1 Tax=Subtercola frigoramans TaxID=120298 RepID=A0ABS2L2Z8_9MICO|nr:thioredoxin domain-containing protein [Subtercola frigoramans]MBM7471476.1 protein-disulfide isomerase [Subtercola frigoramans]
MTNGRPEDSRQSKNQRREAAREKAKVLREEQRKKDLRNRWILFSGIGVVVVAIIVCVVLIVASSVKTAGPGPLNMASDGIKITTGNVAVTTPALAAGEQPTPSAANPTGVLDIRVYIDYMCPYCGQFETTNTEQISKWLTQGAATYEVHPLSLLDRSSLGTKYSTRAANAAACVANYSPNNFFDFNSLLFTNQPAENTSGLTDAQLQDYVKQSGAGSTDTINSCITNQDFKGWVADSTTRATTEPLPGSTLAKVTGTPTVLVDGQQYQGSLTDANAFANFVLQVSGQSSSSATPTPTPAS